MATLDPTAKRGRPPGEVSPEGMIRAELIAHLKLYKRTREIVEKRLEHDDLLEVDDLTKYMELLRKGIVEMSKPILPNAKAGDVRPEANEEDAEKILQKLLEGGR